MKKLFVLFATFILLATAQAAPTAIVVPFGPGGSSDIVARTLAKGLPDGEYYVLNMPGGKGIPAIQHIINNPSVMVASLVQYYVSNPLTVPNLPYNINTDVDLIGAIGVVPNVLICNNKTVPAKNFKELSTLKRSLNIGVSAIGSQEHIVVEIIATKLSTAPQTVAYSQGGVSYMPDLISGNIDCIAGLYPAVKPHLSNPNLTAIIATHRVDDVLESWESVFSTSFPLQGVSGLLVSKNINTSSQHFHTYIFS